MPLRGILNTARTLSFYTKLQELTANNLANSDTDGFKADYMSAMLPSSDAFPVPVQKVDLNQGSLNATGRELDVALEGPGFMVLQTPAGERLSRGGSLMLDGANQLSDRHGNLVLGNKGPIAIPIQHGKIEIQADGGVVVDGTQVGQLRMETVADQNTLLKEGAGRFITSTPTIPVTTATTTLHQGQVEQSNQDSLKGMVDLVTIQRAYAANVDALKAMDSVLGNVVNEVGKSDA
ncbi:MAG: flagellar hook basal-body protein [Gemmatimonadota bacterium]